MFSARFDPLVGGVESFSLNLSRELIREGHRVTVVTERIGNSPETELRKDGVHVVRLPACSLVNDRLPLSRRNSRHFELLDSIDFLDDARVLVNNRFYPHSINGLRFAAKIHAPAIVLDHGTAYLTLGKPLADWAIRCYEHVMTARVKRFRPTFAGISQKSTDWLEQFGISTDIVIPNAIDAVAFRKSSSGRDFRAELGIDPEAVMISFVGRLTPEKGSDVLVRAAEEFNHDVVFALAGAGVLRKKLESQAGSNVHFLGLINHNDLSALLQSSDAFCLPTRSEGFCTSLLESAACGIPAIMPDVGGVQEVIRNASSGIVVADRSEDSIVAGIKKAIELDDVGRKLLGSNAQRTVEHCYSWPATARALDKAFSESMEHQTEVDQREI